MTSGLKWWSTGQEFVAQHTQAPNIHSGAMVMSLHHLGREVIQCPAQCLAPTVGRMHRPSKICNLELTLESNQQIFGFDITMNHMLRMAVDQCVAKRHDVRSSSSFVECPAALQFFVKFPFCGIFQDQVHTTGVVEVAVQPQDVWMAKVRLDLNLSAQLVLDMGLLKLVFEKNL